MSKKKAEKYRVIRPVKIDGKDYQVGEEVEVDEKVIKEAPWCFEVVKDEEEAVDGKGRQK